MSSVAVAWHRAECGNYSADLPFWRELAAREAAGGEILDVGAGTGRVALDLARRGHRVVALDRDPELLAEITHPAIEPVVADAQSFDLGERRFPLILVPMQTLQLLDHRAGFYAAARRHLLPGGLLAAAIATDLEPFEGPLPTPDRTVLSGRTYLSQPVAIRRVDGAFELVRERRWEGGSETDVIRLAHLTPEEAAAEAEAEGFTALEPAEIAATADHVASTVVLLRG